MSLPRSSSTASSGSASSAGSAASGSSAGSAAGVAGGKRSAHAQPTEEDEGQGLQAGAFGVLYTLAREKLDSSNRIAVLKVLLDFIQIFILIVNPRFGWDINENAWIWKGISWVMFVVPIINQGYTVYIILQLTIAALLGISLLCCVWVGWCFKNDNFPYIWPIKFLRIVVATFFVVFYIGSLTIFMVALSCNWFVDDPLLKYHVHAFPEVACFTMPHIAYMAVAFVSAIVFCGISFLMTMADFELDPKCKRWLGSPHARVEVRTILARTVMTMSGSLLFGLTKVQAWVLFTCCAFVFYSYVRWQPHFNEWMNHARSGLFCTVWWASIMLLVLVYGTDSHEDQHQFSAQTTSTMVYGLVPVFVLGAATSFARLRLLRYRQLNNFMPDAEVPSRLKDVYRFHDPYEVEILSRVCRRTLPEDDEVLDPEYVKVSEYVIRVGMVHFYNDFFMLMTYSNIMLEVCNNYQTGTSQLQQAKKRTTGLSDKFAIFVREQEAKQRARTHGSGENATDLVSYVEFQRNCTMLTRTHFDALMSMKVFWKLLQHQTVKFSDLSKALHTVENAKSRADRTFKTVLDRYPSSSKILRSYGQFLEYAKNDPWKASHYYKEADKVEEEPDEIVQEGLEPADTESMLQSKSNAVVSINAFGSIEMANKPAYQLFGYKKGELEGKNVSMLMPNPFQQRHDTFLKNYNKTGHAKILDSVREVVGLHKERYVFPVSILVSKVSGTGDDALFMGVVKPAKDDPECVKVLAMPQGIIMCVDRRYEDWFGKGIETVTGHPLASIVQEQDTIAKLLDMAQGATDAEVAAGALQADCVHVLHRFMEPVPCSLMVELGGTDSYRVLKIVLRRKTPAFGHGMLVANHNGRIIYTNTDLRTMLGYTVKQASKLTLPRLMNPPYSIMHSKWMKESSARVPLQSCRNAATVVMVDSQRTSMPVKTHIATHEENDEMLYVVNVEKSSWAQGLDERRLMLAIDFSGVVQAAGPSPDALLGFKPSLLIGHCLTDFIDVFAELHTEVEEMINKMVQKVGDRPGYSWRVGVHPIINVEDNLNASALTRAVLTRNTKAVLMQLEVKEPENEGELPTLKLFLWRADMVTGVVEMDRDTVVTKPACCALHPSGMLFGCADKRLMRQQFRKFIQFPGAGAESLLMERKNVKGAMKGLNFSGVKIGKLACVEGFHTDGAPLKIRLTAMVTEADRIVAKCNFENLSPGDAQVFKSTLAEYEAKRMGVEEEEAMIVAAMQAGASRPGTSMTAAAAAATAATAMVGSRSLKLRRVPSWDKMVESDSEDDIMLAAGGDSDNGLEDEDGSEANAKDATRVADYRQGKRYKQLVSLLSSKPAKADLLRYERHTYMISALVFLLHLAVFITLTILLDGLSQYVTEVAACSSAVFMLQKVMIYSRAIANIYANNTNPMWYSMSTLDDIAGMLKQNIDDLEHYHQGLYLGFNQLRRTTGALADAWEGRNAPELVYLDIATPRTKNDTVSLWDLGNQILDSSREILQNHADIALQTGNNFTLNRNFQYLLLNGADTVSVRYRSIMDLFIARTEDRIALVGYVGMAMLVVEGIVLCMAAAVWTFWLLESVSRRRYTLYKVFLVVPTALLRALAAKKVHIEGMDDDDDGDDDDAPPAAGQGGAADPAASQGTMLLESEKVAGNFKELLLAGSQKGGMETKPSLGQRMWSSVAKTYRSLAGTDVAVVGKKKLVLDGRDTLTLTLPFILWGALVISMYAASYTMLHQISEPLITLNVAGRVEIRAMRAIFAAHELVSATTDAAKASLQKLVLQRSTELYDMQHALLYGSHNYSALVWPDTPATLFMSQDPANYFFLATGVCYDVDRPDLYCFTKMSDMYHMVANYALDPMIARLSDEMNSMSKDALYDIAMNSTRFDYIWRVAYMTLADGLWQLTTVYAREALVPVTNAKLLHTVLFILSLVLGLFFLIFLFRPFIKRASAEAVQVAELLSYLPPGMDVEGLVSSVLALDETTSSLFPGKGRGRASQGLGGGTSQAGGASQGVDTSGRSATRSLHSFLDLKEAGEAGKGAGEKGKEGAALARAPPSKQSSRDDDSDASSMAGSL